MVRFLIVLVILGAIGVVVWWDRTDKSRKRQVFFSLYNKALSNAKDKDKLFGVSINILDVMDETDISPTPLNKILKAMEGNRYLNIRSNIVKLTPEGVAYFKFKYLSEKVKEGPHGLR